MYIWGKMIYLNYYYIDMQFVPAYSAVHCCTAVMEHTLGLGEEVVGLVRETGLSCKGSGHWGSGVEHWASFLAAEDRKQGRVEVAVLGGTEVCWDTVAGSCTVAHTAVSIFYLLYFCHICLKDNTHINNTHKWLQRCEPVTCVPLGYCWPPGTCLPFIICGLWYGAERRMYMPLFIIGPGAAPGPIFIGPPLWGIP